MSSGGDLCGELSEFLTTNMSPHRRLRLLSAKLFQKNSRKKAPDGCQVWHQLLQLENLERQPVWFGVGIWAFQTPFPVTFDRHLQRTIQQALFRGFLVHGQLSPNAFRSTISARYWCMSSLSLYWNMLLFNPPDDYFYMYLSRE